MVQVLYMVLLRLDELENVEVPRTVNHSRRWIRMDK